MSDRGSFSPLRPEHADALLELLRQTLIHEPLHAALLHEKLWGDPRFEEELAFHSGPATQPTGLVMGVVRQRGDERIGVVKLLAVAPEVQGRGLGRSLLGQCEQQFARRGLARLQLCSSPPNYLVPGLDPRYERAQRFFRAAGYEVVGETQHLEVDLTHLPSTAEASSGLRRALVSDRTNLRELLASHWPAWIPEVEIAFGQEPISLHLAIQAERVVAFAAYDCNNLGTGAFGPMGTAPELRGQGLGRLLLLRCLRDLAAQGHVRAIIPWVGPVAFYRESANAQPLRRFLLMEKRLA